MSTIQFVVWGGQKIDYIWKGTITTNQTISLIVVRVHLWITFDVKWNYSFPNEYMTMHSIKEEERHWP